MVNEAILRGLLDAAPDALVSVDAGGTIILVNAQAEPLFGYTRHELLGQPVEMLLPAAARGGHERHRDGYIGDPRTRPMGAGLELAGRRSDGTEFPAEISLSALQAPDGLLVTAAIRDVTDRVAERRERDQLAAQATHDRLEAELQQSRRLESLGQLAGGVAHDFNNLLSVILNYTDFVSATLKQVASGNPAEAPLLEAIHDLAQIEEAGRRAARLTAQLLAFARREPMRAEWVDLNAVIREIQELLSRSLGEQVRLETALQSDLPSIEADRGQIEQVLVNLAVNARDAMPRGGVLTIDTALIEVDEAYSQQHPDLASGTYARLRVSDTGVGMTPEVRACAFEPFFTTKAVGEGSGLGLATIYGIVTQAGGGVRLYSEPGLGTTVTILLPAAVEGAAPIGPDDSLPESAGTRTILLVEDEPALRDVTQRILERADYVVLVAQDGADAVRLARTHPRRIDLLLTDVVMPSMGGQQVASEVTTIRPTVQVLYMSGYTKQIASAQGSLIPGVQLLPKPFNSPELLDAVARALAQTA